MKQLLIVILLALGLTSSWSQAPYVLTGKDTGRVKEFAVLADANYSIEKVSSDTALQFVVNGKLDQHLADYYWVKFVVNNTSSSNENYDVWLGPAYENTIYWYDSSSRKWLSETRGYAVRNNRRNFIPLPYVFGANKQHVVYLKINLKPCKSYNFKPRLSIELLKEAYNSQKAVFIWTTWLATMIILVFFVLYSSYTYFAFKDKAYLYYLFVLIGGAAYITSYKFYFGLILPGNIVNLMVWPSGGISYFSMDTFINRLGSVCVIYGFIQLARTYLNTQKTLPKFDSLLKWLNGIYATLMVTSALLTITGIKFIDILTLTPTNVLVLVIVISILVTGFVSYYRGFKPAKYFLLANIAPLLTIFVLAASLIFIDNRMMNNWISLLPNLTVVCMAITFAVALAERIKLIRREIANKESEAEELKLQVQQFEEQKQLLEQQKQQLALAMQQEMDKNNSLQEKLEANQRELASNTMYIYQKKQVMSYLKNQMRELGSQLPDTANKAKLNIESTIKNDVFAEGDWEKFKLHFEQVHPNFFQELAANYPTLTKSETRLCAYLHLKMSTKEIAALLNIDPASVRRAKTRLNKKIGRTIFNLSEN